MEVKFKLVIDSEACWSATNKNEWI